MLKFIKMKYITALTYCIIQCYLLSFYRDWKLFCKLKSDIKKIENSSGLHFFMFETFDQRRWKLRQESHAPASNQNDNQLDFNTFTDK